MITSLRFFSVLILIACLTYSCELKNKFTDKESKDTVAEFNDNQLNFIIDLSDFTKGELTVYFKIASITKQYKIDSLNLTVCDNKSDQTFELKGIKTYDGMVSEIKEFRDFNSASTDRKIIDETIKTYYAIDHIFIVPNVDDTKNYRININAKISTTDSSYNMTKTILFKRSKHFSSIRWSGC